MVDRQASGAEHGVTKLETGCPVAEVIPNATSVSSFGKSPYASHENVIGWPGENVSPGVGLSNVG
jgi:hypothetical protein